jgi:hypothetical protein
MAFLSELFWRRTGKDRYGLESVAFQPGQARNGLGAPVENPALSPSGEPKVTLGFGCEKYERRERRTIQLLIRVIHAIRDR